ncbi:MAG: T9SS type A sorting domain-containing protein [Ferruginibacter sp.]
MVSAQPCLTNVLINPSFESPAQPNLGNNFSSPYNVFNGWRIPLATENLSTGGFNIVKVNGTSYPNGPVIANGIGNQYIDVLDSSAYVEQNFALTCPATITFSGWFSRREPGGTGFSGFIDINDGATVVATSSLATFASNESKETWKQVTGTANLPIGTYTFRFSVDDFANIDNAFLCASPAGCVLPVSIADFYAVSEKCINKLSWITSSEINANRFDIEYSATGVAFKTVGSLPAKNVSTGNSYSFNHKTVAGAKSFYRLKAIDIDGKITYSKIVNVASTCNTFSINIYPNPVADVLHVNVFNNSSAKLVVFNTDGKMVLPFTTLKNGANEVTFKTLSRGVYIVKIFSVAETKVIRIIKM